MAGCRILPQPAIHKLIDSGRLKGSLRRAHARPCPAKPPTQNSKEAIHDMFDPNNTKRHPEHNEKQDRHFIDDAQCI
jgi:hypothetical protein